jgi:hypothetical protein
MQPDSNITQEEVTIVAELQQILQKISNALHQLPVHLKEHLLSDIEIFNQESQSFNSALNSLNTKN